MSKFKVGDEVTLRAPGMGSIFESRWTGRKAKVVGEYSFDNQSTEIELIDGPRPDGLGSGTFFWTTSWLDKVGLSFKVGDEVVITSRTGYQPNGDRFTRTCQPTGKKLTVRRVVTEGRWKDHVLASNGVYYLARTLDPAPAKPGLDITHVKRAAEITGKDRAHRHVMELAEFLAGNNSI